MHISLSLPLLNLNLALTRALLAFFIEKETKNRSKRQIFLKKKGAG